VSGDEFRQQLAANLSADAAGHSRAMSADERATIAALDVRGEPEAVHRLREQLHS
jgi:hypothetical protein